MPTAESECSINSPARRIDPVQPTYAPGSNVMGTTVDISNRVHVNQRARFPDIIPNTSLRPSNYRSNSSGALNQEAVPSLSYQRLMSIERPPKGSQPNNALLSTARIQSKTTSELPDPIPDSADPRPTVIGESEQSARSQTLQISAIASNHCSQSKASRRGRKRKRPWSALRISWPRGHNTSSDNVLQPVTNASSRTLVPKDESLPKL